MSDDESQQRRFGHLSCAQAAEFHRGDEEEEPSEDEEEEEEAEAEEESGAQLLTRSMPRLAIHDRAESPFAPRAPLQSPLSCAVPSPRPQQPLEVIAKGPKPLPGPGPGQTAGTDPLRISRGPPISRSINEKLIQKLQRNRRASGASTVASSSSCGFPADSSAAQAAAGFRVGGGERLGLEPDQLMTQWELHRRADEWHSLDRCNKDTSLIRLVRAGDMDGLEAHLNGLQNSYRLYIELNTPNATQLTPLAIAVFQENYDAIRRLVQKGAHPGTCLAMGNNCFHLVADHDDRGVCLVTLLEEAVRRYGAEELEEMLNTANMFHAYPLDVLYVRLEAARDRQLRQALEVMIKVMRANKARTNMGHGGQNRAAGGPWDAPQATL